MVEIFELRFLNLSRDTDTAIQKIKRLTKSINMETQTIEYLLLCCLENSSTLLMFLLT